MYHATAIQKQFWIAHQQRPDCPAHNIPSVFRVQGSLEVEAWRQSINAIVANHEIFRSYFSLALNDLFMLVNPPLKLDVPILSCKEGQWEGMVQEEISHPFDLSHGPLIRAKIFRLGLEEWILTISCHHIIFDLRTKVLVGREISANYENLVKGKSLICNPSENQYRDYCTWQTKFLSGEDADATHSFWEKQLAGQDGVLELSTDFQRPSVQSLLGATIPFDFSLEETRKLKNFSREFESNLFLTLLTTFFLMLHRYSGQQKIIVGVPFTNRRQQFQKNIMGCFMNILPIGVTIHSQTTFRNLLNQVRGLMLAAHRNQEAALETIVQRLEVPRDARRNPLFQFGFTFEHPMDIELLGLSACPIRMHPGGSQLDMFAVLDDSPQGLRGYMEYRTSLFSRETVSMFADNFQAGIQEVMENPDLVVGALDVLAQNVRDKIQVHWNETAWNFNKPENLKELFEDQVKKTPNNIALMFNEESLTYQALNSRTNQLAHYLRANGVNSDVPVGIFMDRSLEMVEAIYGIVKAGGAYVPIDPGYPEARLMKILEDSQPQLVLTAGRQASAFSAFSAKQISLDEVRDELAEYPTDNLEKNPNPDNPAYIIFTSGTSGNPKGVVNAHRGVSNRILWMQKEFGLEESDRVLQKTTFSFDVSVWEFFWPLTVGACLVIAPPESHRDPIELERIISEKKITVLHFVPSMLQAFLATATLQNCRSLKRVISSGEELSLSLVKHFHEASDANLANLYGPTEAAVDVTCWHCNRDSKASVVPIGKPIANTQIYILDRDLKSVPPGAHGEIYIGGVQVALGYINRPELTSESFISDPFKDRLGAKLYRTGDLGRYLPDGNIEYLGRLDSQIKIRGFRIELREIEAALTNHPSVSSAAVKVEDHGEGDQRLFAFAVPDKKSGLFPRHGVHYGLNKPTQSYLVNEVLDSLKMVLPEYMVPTTLEWIEELPVGPTGKVDRQLLPAIRNIPPRTKATFVSPKSKMEKTLAVLWAEVLKLEHVSRDDSFFDLGGNSLLSIYLANKIKEKLNRDISVVLLFQYPTIKLLARFLDEGAEEEDLAAKATDRAAQRRLARGSRPRGGSKE